MTAPMPLRSLTFSSIFPVRALILFAKGERERGDDDPFLASLASLAEFELPEDDNLPAGAAVSCLGLALFLLKHLDALRGLLGHVHCIKINLKNKKHLDFCCFC